MRTIEVRFSGVVFPGETITTDMWQVDAHTIIFTARTERGEALSNAAATIA
jgi:acyl dehydratase